MQVEALYGLGGRTAIGRSAEDLINRKGFRPVSARLRLRGFQVKHQVSMMVA